MLTRDGREVKATRVGPESGAEAYMITIETECGPRPCNSRPLTRSQLGTLECIAFMVYAADFGRAIDAVRLCDGMPRGALQYVEHGGEKSAPAP
jgi:hypothetical protein